MTDALNQPIKAGRTVIYIQKTSGGSLLYKGVVIKVNKKKHNVQPLRVQMVGQSYIDLFATPPVGVVQYPDGKYAIPVSPVLVHENRMAVTDGYDWPEYKEFIRNEWVTRPLDTSFMV